MSKNLEDKIKDWLEKTGYPLELYCANLLAQSGFSFSSSTLYKDFETSLAREIDHIAWQGWDGKNFSIELQLIIECKKSDKPFLLLTTNESNKDVSLVSVLNFYSHSEDGNVLPLLNFQSAIRDIDCSILPKDAYLGYKAIQTLQNNDKLIYEGLLSLSKSLKYNLDIQRSLNDILIADNHHSYIIPTLLIDSPLFKASISNNNLELEPIEYGFINFQSTWNIDVSFSIPIVTKNYLENYLNRISRLGEYFSDFLSMSPRYQIKKTFKRIKRKKSKA